MNDAILKQMEERATDYLVATHANAHELILCMGSLVTEVRRLRQELRDYGEHDGGCYKKYTEKELRRTGWTDEMLAERVCTCGLDAAFGDEPETGADPEPAPSETGDD